MPKIKIGTKVTVGEDTQKVRREFTNGGLTKKHRIKILFIYNNDSYNEKNSIRS